MTRKEALTALLEKVEAKRQKHTARLWFRSEAAVIGEHLLPRMVRAYDGSLDAARGLHEALLPEWAWMVHSTGDVWIYIPSRNAPPTKEVSARDLISSRAWLTAILKALIAEVDQ